MTLPVKIYGDDQGVLSNLNLDGTTQGNTFFFDVVKDDENGLKIYADPAKLALRAQSVGGPFWEETAVGAEQYMSDIILTSGAARYGTIKSLPGIYKIPGISAYEDVTGSSTRWNCIVSRGTNGAPLYVRVGEGGAIESSSNATSWTARTSGTVNMLNFVIYDSYTSKFWAVGASGTMLSSADGITWSAATLPVEVATDNLTGIATNGAGVFVVSNSSSGTRVLYSTDGGGVFSEVGAGQITGATYCVHYTDGYFVLGRSSGTSRLWSYAPASDLVSGWGSGSASLSGGTVINSITSDDTNIIFGGTNGFVQTIPVGVLPSTANSTLRTSDTTQDLRLFVANGRVYAVGSGGVSLESTDNGATWQPGPVTGTVNFLRFGTHDSNNTARALVVGDSGTYLFGNYPIAYKAIDTSSTTRWNCIVTRGTNGAPLYVRVGENGSIEASETGESGSWTPRESGVSEMLNFVGYISRLSLYVALGNSNTILVSTDGINWESRISPVAVSWSAWADNGTIISIVGGSGRTLTTEDFETYTPSSFFGTTGIGSSVVWTGTHFIAGVRLFDTVYTMVQTSTNGITWARNDINHGKGAQTPVEIILWDGNTLYAAGTNGFVATSNSIGATWTVRRTDVFSSLRLFAANDRVYAVGSSGVSLESTDNGVTWQAGPPTGTTNFLRYGTEDNYNKKRTLVVGDSGTMLEGSFSGQINLFDTEEDMNAGTPIAAQTPVFPYMDQPITVSASPI